MIYFCLDIMLLMGYNLGLKSFLVRGGSEMGKGLQAFLEEEKYKHSWKGDADFRMLNAFKACEKAKEVILREGEFDEGRVETIEENFKCIVNYHLFNRLTLHELEHLFNTFYGALDEKRGDRILLTGKLDQVKLKLDEAYKLLQGMSVWSGTVRKERENSKEMEVR